MKLIFPTQQEEYFSFPLERSKDLWPMPYDTCISDLKSRDSPIPEYYLKQYSFIRNLNLLSPNVYKVIPRGQINPDPELYTLHTKIDGPPFAIIDFREQQWKLTVLPWNFLELNGMLMNRGGNNASIVNYLKSVPLGYFNTTQTYLLTRGYEVSRIESSSNYAPFFQERKEKFSQLGQKESTSADVKFDPSLSLTAIKFAMRNAASTSYEAVEFYDIIENYDTADEQNWNSFNALVFQRSVYNAMWKAESTVSIDRIRELMPHAQLSKSTVLAEEQSDQQDESKQPQPQQHQPSNKQQQIQNYSKIDDCFLKLDQLVMLLRERDVDALRSLLEALRKDNYKEFVFAKQFLLKAVDRFSLRGIIDPNFVDSLQ